MNLLKRHFREVPLWFYALLALCVLVQWALAAKLNLSFDEAYYWLWSRHPQLSYYDHPPLVAWTIWLSTAIFGDSELGVRFFAPLCLAGSSLLIVDAVRDFHGDRRAQLVGGLLPLCMLAGHATGLLITPDTLLFLTSSLVLRLLAALYRTGNANLWLAIGIAGGLALLSKYSAVALALGILIWLVLSPQRRGDFLRWQLWAGLVLALLVFSPVLIWNAGHGWASFAKQGGRAAQAFSFNWKTPIDFISAHALLLTPLLAALLMYSGWFQWRSARHHGKRALLLSALALPFPLYLLVLSFGMKVEANWTLVALPVFCILTALTVSENWSRLKNVTTYGLLLGAVLSALMLIYLASPLTHRLGRKDITHRLSGYDEVARITGVEAGKAKACAIVTADYANMAELSYYLRGKWPVLQWNEPERRAGWPQPDLKSCGPLPVAILTSRRLQGEQPIFAQYPAMRRLGKILRWHRGTVVEIYDLWLAKSDAGL